MNSRAVMRSSKESELFVFSGDRNEIRNQSAIMALLGINERIKISKSV